VQRRVGDGSPRVQVQCDYCGRALSNSLKLDQHPRWQTYPKWDDQLAIDWQAEWAEHREADREARHEAWMELKPERTAEYAEFLRTPEWKQLRVRVLERSPWCEACLLCEAVEVHHVSYRSGWLPPAWELRSVCQKCHDRLHAGEDEWNP
jgi:hypothetical protein